jgi:FKBP-type peptidyl-prolyl cis-trans isomerase FklB
MKLLKHIKLSALALVVLMSAQVNAQEIDLNTLEGRAGYSIGVNIGLNLANQGIQDDLDINAVLEGIRDSLLGEEIQLSNDELTQAIEEFTAILQARAEQEISQQSQAGAEFLAQNTLEPGVITTASGLQYLVMEEADASGSMPAASDTVNVHYHGTLIDGTVFDSSVDRGEPISFPLNNVIPGWTEGVQLMKVGDKFRFFIPPELAYGANGAGGAIGPNATLIFEVELLGIE